MSEKEQYKSSLQQAAIDFKKQAIDLGRTSEQAKELKRQKLALFPTEAIYETTLGLLDKITIPVKIPLTLFGGFDEFRKISRKDLDRRLHGVGIDVNFSTVLDVACITLGEARYCGHIITGQERVDREWTSLRVNDKYVASWEARTYGDDPTMLQELSKLQRGG